MDDDNVINVSEQQRLLAMHRRTLKHYLNQQAQLGTAHAPPGIAHGIDEARENIQRVKDILRNWGIKVQDDPDDEYDQNFIPNHNTLNNTSRLINPNITSNRKIGRKTIFSIALRLMRCSCANGRRNTCAGQPLA
jgi:hypothetical protein